MKTVTNNFIELPSQFKEHIRFFEVVNNRIVYFNIKTNIYYVSIFGSFTSLFDNKKILIEIIEN